MKRKFLFVLVLGFCLTACSTKKDEAASTASGNPMPTISIQCGDSSCM